jgi:hypothetical protein
MSAGLQNGYRANWCSRSGVLVLVLRKFPVPLLAAPTEASRVVCYVVQTYVEMIVSNRSGSPPSNPHLLRFHVRLPILLFMPIGWQDVSELRPPPVAHPPHDVWIWCHGGIIVTGETEKLVGKSVPLVLSSPQILHWMTQAQTRASAMTGD